MSICGCFSQFCRSIFSEYLTQAGGLPNGIEASIAETDSSQSGAASISSSIAAEPRILLSSQSDAAETPSTDVRYLVSEQDPISLLLQPDSSELPSLGLTIAEETSIPTATQSDAAETPSFNARFSISEQDPISLPPQPDSSELTSLRLPIEGEAPIPPTSQSVVAQTSPFDLRRIPSPPPTPYASSSVSEDLAERNLYDDFEEEIP